MREALFCPACGNREFFQATARVTETWKTDRFGDFYDIIDTGDESVVDRPNIHEDDYTCTECGEYAKLEEIPNEET